MMGDECLSTQTVNVCVYKFNKRNVYRNEMRLLQRMSKNTRKKCDTLRDEMQRKVNSISSYVCIVLLRRRRMVYEVGLLIEISVFLSEGIDEYYMLTCSITLNLIRKFLVT